MANALYSPYDGYILSDATWSGTTPSTTYALANFSFLRPDWRVKFGVPNPTITATLGGSRQADVLAIPMCNADAGTSPTALRLTNGAGLDVSVEFPSVPADGIPLTAILDLRGLASAGVRSSNVWNFIFGSNSSNLTLGAALWLGTLVEFTANFRPSPIFAERHYNGGDENIYGVVNRVRYRTRKRWADLAVPSRDAQRDQFFEWARAGEGSGLPSIFWPNPSVNDALFGSWPDEVASTWVIHNYSPMEFRFTEWNKGLPLL